MVKLTGLRPKLRPSLMYRDFSIALVLLTALFRSIFSYLEQTWQPSQRASSLGVLTGVYFGMLLSRLTNNEAEIAYIKRIQLI